MVQSALILTNVKRKHMNVPIRGVFVKTRMVATHVAVMMDGLVMVSVVPISMSVTLVTIIVLYP